MSRLTSFANTCSRYVQNRLVWAHHRPFSQSAFASCKRIPATVFPFLLFISFLCTADAADGQTSCVSLVSSRLCPGFSSAQIDTSLSTASWLASVHSTAEFDKALDTFLTTSFLQSKFGDMYHCNGSAGQTFDLETPGVRESLAARYSRTVWCASLVQQSAKTCVDNKRSSDASNAQAEQAQTACAATCLAYTLSVGDILQSATCSHKTLDDGLLSQLRSDYELCVQPDQAYAPSGCIDGADAEGFHCGFDGNVPAYCRYCTRLQRQANGTGDSVEGCCTDASEKLCLPFLGNETTSDLTRAIITRGNRSTILSTAGSATAAKSDSTLSAGAIAGIVIPSILAVLAGLACLWLFFRRNQRRATHQNRLRTLNALDSRGEDGGTISGRPTSARLFARRFLPLPIPIPVGSVPTPGSEQSIRSATSAASPIGPIYPSSEKRQSLDTDRRFSGFVGRPTPFLQQSSERLSVEQKNDSSKETLVLYDQWSGNELKPGNIVRCIRAYEPVLHDELLMRVNDLIKLEQVFADRWAKGRLIRNMDDPVLPGAQADLPLSESKVFPLVCVCAAEYEEVAVPIPPSSHGSTRTASSLASGKVVSQAISLERPLADRVQEAQDAQAQASRARGLSDAATTESSSIGGSTRVPSTIGMLHAAGSSRRFQLRPRPSGLMQASLPTRTVSSQVSGNSPSSPLSDADSPIQVVTQPNVTLPGSSRSPSEGIAGSRFTEQLGTSSSSSASKGVGPA